MSPILYNSTLPFIPILFSYPTTPQHDHSDLASPPASNSTPHPPIRTLYKHVILEDSLTTHRTHRSFLYQPGRYARRMKHMAARKLLHLVSLLQRLQADRAVGRVFHIATRKQVRKKEANGGS